MPKAKRPAGPPPRVGDEERGIASWYGHPYHGRVAANGEVYDMEKMTAAHRTLPFGTWVRVMNLDNGRSVDLRITDRGPFIDGRIIDVSRAGARAIELIGPGTARVVVRVIAAPEEAVAVSSKFGVQVGAFQSRDSAERMREQMATRYGSAKLVPRDGPVTLWRVLVGEFEDEAQADDLAARIRETSPAFTVRLDRP